MGIVLLTVGAGALWSSRQTLPPGALAEGQTGSLRLLDRTGRLLRDIPRNPHGRSQWVPVDAVAADLVAATLVAEDRRFFAHGGVDVIAAVRAALSNLKALRIVSGASTLTMQLARVIEPERRTLRAKARQAVLALRIESRLSKLSILEHYLNRIPYGRGAIGVAAAAQRYFATDVAQLSLAQCALLAALPQAPSFHGSAAGHDALRRRQRAILAQLLQHEVIDHERYRRALAEPLAFARTQPRFDAPHFTSGLSRRLRHGGEVRTTLDFELQRRVERLVRQRIAALRDQGVTNAAVLVVDNRTREVLAHVGSENFLDSQHSGQLDGVHALRQPGSAIKPFVYALGLERGFSLASLLDDLPAHFQTKQGTYIPQNYDRAYRGPVRLRIALASSLNIPAIRMAHALGPAEILTRLRDLGFDNLNAQPEHYGLGIALGNGEVTLFQLTAAYAALADRGRFAPLRRIYGEPTKTARQVIAPLAAELITDALADPRARAIGFGRGGPLEVPVAAAVKTGTSKDFHDNWTVGYTKELTVGVWVGNFDASPMHRVSGVTGAGPLWHEVLLAAIDELKLQPAPLRRAEPRQGGPQLIRRPVCSLSGMAPGPACPHVTDELFASTHPLSGPCSMHRKVAIDRRNGLLGSTCPRALSALEDRVTLADKYLAWGARQGLALAPRVYSPFCPAPRQLRARLRVRYPSEGAVFVLDPDLPRIYQRVPLEAEVSAGLKAVSWHVDGVKVTTARFPFGASWQLQPGPHRVELRTPAGDRSPLIRFWVRH